MHFSVKYKRYEAAAERLMQQIDIKLFFPKRASHACPGIFFEHTISTQIKAKRTNSHRH